MSVTQCHSNWINSMLSSEAAKFFQLMLTFSWTNAYSIVHQSTPKPMFEFLWSNDHIHWVWRCFRVQVINSYLFFFCVSLDSNVFMSWTSWWSIKRKIGNKLRNHFIYPGLISFIPFQVVTRMSLVNSSPFLSTFASTCQSISIFMIDYE